MKLTCHLQECVQSVRTMLEAAQHEQHQQALRMLEAMSLHLTQYASQAIWQLLYGVLTLLRDQITTHIGGVLASLLKGDYLAREHIGCACALSRLVWVLIASYGPEFAINMLNPIRPAYVPQINYFSVTDVYDRVLSELLDMGMTKFMNTMDLQDNKLCSIALTKLLTDCPQSLVNDVWYVIALRPAVIIRTSPSIIIDNSIKDGMSDGVMVDGTVTIRSLSPSSPYAWHHTITMVITTHVG